LPVEPLDSPLQDFVLPALPLGVLPQGFDVFSQDFGVLSQGFDLPGVPPLFLLVLLGQLPQGPRQLLL